MEDLKSTITSTDTLKNDLKLASDKINDAIISGGGVTIANTLNEVPKRMKECWGNYSRVAFLKRL